MNPLREPSRRRGDPHGPAWFMVAAVTLVVLLVMAVRAPSAQQAPLHLNPAVEKLAQGKPIIGTNTSDLSLQNCHALARLDFDYVYFDMEHGPMNLEGLAYCVAATVDKAAALKKGNAPTTIKNVGRKIATSAMAAPAIPFGF